MKSNEIKHVIMKRTSISMQIWCFSLLPSSTPAVIHRNSMACSDSSELLKPGKTMQNPAAESTIGQIWSSRSRHRRWWMTLDDTWPSLKISQDLARCAPAFSCSSPLCGCWQHDQDALSLEQVLQCGTWWDMMGDGGMVGMVGMVGPEMIQLFNSFT